MAKTAHGWMGPDLEARIAAHVRSWQQAKQAGRLRPETYPFVAVSREYGCEAVPLAKRLVEILNERCRPSIAWAAYDRELLDKVASELHLHRSIVESLDGRRRDEMSELFDNILNRKVDEAVVFRKLAEVIRTLAIHGHAVLVGRGSVLLTQDLKNGLHVRLVAPREWRVHKVASERNISWREAESTVDEGERQRHHYISTFFVLDPKHPFHHDLVIDNSRFNVAQIAEIIFTALGARFGETLVAA
jgi:cytidylate kinase